MYYLYCIAYRISDEMKAKKEAQKPFWWEHLHPEVKERTIEEIEKELLETGQIPAEILAEMPKNEKFLAISEGYYCEDCAQADKVAAELESLKKDIVERSKTGFLNQPSVDQPSAGTGVVQQESLEPIVLGQTPPSPIPSLGADPLAVKTETGLFPDAGISPQGSSLKLDDEHLSVVSSQIKDADLKNDDSPFGGALPGDDKIPATSPSKAELRRYAQSIVGSTVKEINSKADSVPDNVAVMKEQELLDAVIDELKAVRSKHS